MSNQPCTICKGTQRIPLFMPGSTVPCECVTQAVAPAPESQEDEVEAIIIDGNAYTFESKNYDVDGGGVEISTDGGDYIVFPDADDAGAAARLYWENMAENDPSEFACMVGNSTLVAWGMRQFAGPGTTQVRSLEEWLDLWLSTPEEQWAGYDSAECEVGDVTQGAEDEIGFKPGVAYRTN